MPGEPLVALAVAPHHARAVHLDDQRLGPLGGLDNMVPRGGPAPLSHLLVLEGQHAGAHALDRAVDVLGAQRYFHLVLHVLAGQVETLEHRSGPSGLLCHQRREMRLGLQAQLLVEDRAFAPAIATGATIDAPLEIHAAAHGDHIAVFTGLQQRRPPFLAMPAAHLANIVLVLGLGALGPNARFHQQAVDLLQPFMHEQFETSSVRQSYGAVKNLQQSIDNGAQIGCNFNSLGVLRGEHGGAP